MKTMPKLLRPSRVAEAVTVSLRTPRPKKNAACASALALGLCLALSAPAEAAQFTVTNTNDVGAGSLRQAVLDANANPGVDEIVFSSVSGDITLSSGQIEITDAVDIHGPGAAKLTVDGNASADIFVVNALFRAVKIAGLTLTNARNAVRGEHFDRLLLSDSVITGNTSGVSVSSYYYSITIVDSEISGNAGYGVSSRYADVNIEGSTLSENGRAGLHMYGSTGVIRDTIVSGNARAGLRIRYFSDLLVQTCTIADNGTEFPAGGVVVDKAGVRIEDSLISGNSGGGVDVYLGGANIARSTLSGNHTQGRGGALYVHDGSFASVTDSILVSNSAVAGGGVAGLSLRVEITNSTLSGNVATGPGGAVYGQVSVFNSTLFGNHASEGGGGIVYGGHIANSIIAGNTASLAGPDLGGTGVFNIDYSLVQDPGSATLNETVPGSNVLGVDPLLGPLQDNGGPTQTHALLAGSPAIDRGDPVFTPPPKFDQRGPAFGRVANRRIDIGAYESPGPAITIEKLINGMDADEPSGPRLVAGSTYRAVYRVSNAGSVPLKRVKVYDRQVEPTPLPWTLVCNLDRLGVGRTKRCVQPLAPVLDGQRNILGIAQGKTPDGEFIKANDPASYVGEVNPMSALSMFKTVNGRVADDAPGVVVVPGETLSFGYTATNRGNVDLFNVRVYDREVLPEVKPWELVCTLGHMAVGENRSCDRVSAPAGVGQHNVLGIAQGRDSARQFTRDKDNAFYLGQP